MFADLPASGARSITRLSGGVLAACTHGALIGVAVWATAVRASPPQIIPIIDAFPAPVNDNRPPVPGSFSAPRIPDCVDCGLADIPVDAPTGTFDSLLPRITATTPVSTGQAGDAPLGGDGVLPVDLVEQRPEVLAGPPLGYPELLRQAGIQGRVVVRAVVDTLGRVEVGSASIVASANPGFDAPALAYVRRALFRPARVWGRAVRVLVDVPIDFRIVR